MTPEEQAKLLAAWLERTPGPDDADPPEGVDDDVVEAIYALRPDLAPPPRIDLDDILGSLTEGPLAGAPVSATPDVDPVVEPIQEPVAEVVPFAPRRRRWLAPTAATGTLLAMAAALLLTVLVYEGGAPEPATAVYEPYAPRAGLDRPAPASEPEDVARVEAEPTEAPSVDTLAVERKGKVSEDPSFDLTMRDQVAATGYVAGGEAGTGAATAPLSSSVATHEGTVDQGLLAKEERFATTGRAGVSAEPSQEEVPTRAARQLDEAPPLADPVAAPPPVAVTPRPRPAASPEPAPRPSPAPASARPSPTDPGSQAAAGPPPDARTKPSASEGSATAAVTPTSPDRPAREDRRAAEAERPAEPEVAVADLEEMDDAAGQLAGDGRMEQTTTEVVSVERRRGFSFGSRKAEPSADSTVAMPRLDLALLRRSALPPELAPTWPTTSPTTLGDEADARKDAASADATLVEAARATRTWLDARAYAQAADAAEAGLALPVGPTPERSMLLVLYGDALAGLGDTYGAAAAYEAARQANDARRRPSVDAAPATTSE